MESALLDSRDQKRNSSMYERGEDSELSFGKEQDAKLGGGK